MFLNIFRKSRQKEIYKKIEYLTRNLREKFKIQTPVTEADLIRLIKELGGEIEYTSQANFETHVIKIANSDTKPCFVITIPKHIRKDDELTFKIAQMIGEVILDMRYRINNEKYDKYPLYIQNRPQIDYNYINYFACALLMPKTEYVLQITEHTKDRNIDIKAVAEYFHTDVQTVYTYGITLDVLWNG